MKSLLFSFFVLFYLLNADAASVRFFQSIPGFTVNIIAPPLAPILQVGYGQSTPYQIVPDGAYTWKVTMNNQTLVEAQVPLAGDVHYTYAPVYANGGYTMQAFFENLEGAVLWQPGQALLRFIHLAHTEGAATVEIGPQVLVQGATLLSHTTFTPLAANATTVKITLGNWVLNYNAGVLSANTMYTVILTSASMNATTTNSTDRNVQVFMLRDRCYSNFTCSPAPATTGVIATNGPNGTTTGGSSRPNTRPPTTTSSTQTNTRPTRTSTNTASTQQTNTKTQPPTTRPSETSDPTIPPPVDIVASSANVKSVVALLTAVTVGMIL